MASRWFSPQPYPRVKQDKPGELLLCLGLVGMVVAPAFLVFQGEADRANAALLERGVVSAASVIGHAEQTENYTGRRGRPRSSTTHLLEVRYDTNAATPYAEWHASGTLRASAYPALTTQQIAVGSGTIADLPLGTQTHVVRLPDDYTSLQVVAVLEHETSLAYRLGFLLAVAAAFLAGLAMAVAGWRKRRAAR